MRTPVKWVGDCNAHNPLWETKRKNNTGATIEELLEKYSVVVLDDGRHGNLSCIGLTLISSENNGTLLIIIQ